MKISAELSVSYQHKSFILKHRLDTLKVRSRSLDASAKIKFKTGFPVLLS